MEAHNPATALQETTTSQRPHLSSSSEGAASGPAVEPPPRFAEHLTAGLQPSGLLLPLTTLKTQRPTHPANRGRHRG
jgi:hypothetical protein